MYYDASSLGAVQEPVRVETPEADGGGGPGDQATVQTREPRRRRRGSYLFSPTERRVRPLDQIPHRGRTRGRATAVEHYVPAGEEPDLFATFTTERKCRRARSREWTTVSAFRCRAR